ncbi:ubiquitin, partial [Gamsiella multidivaricata]|uniref:ubiquitin n=1 Tax=Gamsiella multidivaricata TaxID=101098 RepID=UPI00221F760C
IHVTTLTGAAMDINCNSSDTIRQVKKTIYVKGWIHPQRHALFFRSRELENDKALGDYKIRFGSTLRSVRYLRGG